MPGEIGGKAAVIGATLVGMENVNENLLAAENRRLKALLDEHGIGYELVGPINRSNNRLLPVSEITQKVMDILNGRDRMRFGS